MEFFQISLCRHCYKLSSLNCFIMFHILRLFSLKFRKSLIPSFISSLIHWWFRWALYNFHMLVNFLKLVLLLSSNFKPWWSDKIHEANSKNFVSTEVFLCYLVCNQFLRKFHEVLRRRYVLLFLDVMFYRCLLNLFGTITLFPYFSDNFLSGRSVQRWEWWVDVSHY